jgi:hypothetical protein
MLKLIEYSDDLNLDEFYRNALIRGYYNNSSKSIMVDSLKSDWDYKVWILYNGEQAIGATAAHSLDIIPNSYRICARTCLFTDLMPSHRNLRTLNNIREHQHITAQYYIPQCVEYCPVECDLYITSHPSEIASQKLVHDIFCPILEDKGCLEKTHELMYRGHLQTFWKLNKVEFMKQLQQYPRWSASFYNQQ